MLDANILPKNNNKNTITIVVGVGF